MARVLRFERFDARLDKARRTGAGGARIRAHIAKAGNVQVYQHNGKERREYRDPAAVFHPDALESLRDAPITIGHPTMVGTDTWRSHAIGHVSGTPTRDGDLVAAELLISDADALQQIEDGSLQEISVGYWIEEDPTPGVSPRGERFDIRQAAVRANHVGLGPEGWARAGREARLRLDGNEETPNMTTHEDAHEDAATLQARWDAEAQREDAAFQSMLSPATRAFYNAPAGTPADVLSELRQDAHREHMHAEIADRYDADATDEFAAADRSRAHNAALGRPQHARPGALSAAHTDAATTATERDDGDGDESLDEFAAAERSRAHHASLWRSRGAR